MGEMPKLPDGWKRKTWRPRDAWWITRYKHSETGSGIYQVEQRDNTIRWILFWTDNEGREWKVTTTSLTDALLVFKHYVDVIPCPHCGGTSRVPCGCKVYTGPDLDVICECGHTRRQHTDPQVYAEEACVECKGLCEDFQERKGNEDGRTRLHTQEDRPPETE